MKNSAADCPWCHVADVAVESMQCTDRVVTGVDEDNGPVYWAECQRCGAQGPIVGWAADAIPKWNEHHVPAPSISSDAIERALRIYHGADWPHAFNEFEIGCYRIDMERAIVAAIYPNA